MEVVFLKEDLFKNSILPYTGVNEISPSAWETFKIDYVAEANDLHLEEDLMKAVKQSEHKKRLAEENKKAEADPTTKAGLARVNKELREIICES